MTTIGLDELYKTIQSTARQAQTSLDQKHASLLESVINVNDEGETDFLSWECQLPSGDGSHRKHQLLRVPLASLFPAEQITISELSLEFDCNIKRKHRAKDSTAEFKITPVDHASNKKTSKFKLVADMDNDYFPASSIDAIETTEYLGHYDQLVSTTNNYWKTLSRQLILFFVLFIIEILIILLSA